jgi:transcriptional regulator with XRE-family HTH domain
MGYGYSQSLAEANKQADARSLGVALGRKCIQLGISVRDVADHFAVSRMTIYNWFKGECIPSTDLTVHIERYIKAISKK